MKRLLLLVFLSIGLLVNAQDSTRVIKTDSLHYAQDSIKVERIIDSSKRCFTTEHLQFTILFGGQITTGNFQNYGFNSALDLRCHNKHHYWDIAPMFRYTKTFSSGKWSLKELEFYSNQAYYRRFDGGKWKFIAFSEIEHSFLRKTKIRGDVGIGISYTVIKEKMLTFEVSEVVLPDLYASDSSIRNNFALRSSTRFKLIINVYPFTFTSVNLFQPELCGWQISDGHIINQKDNIDFRSTNTLDISIKKGFSIGGKVDIIYQTYPHFISESAVNPIIPYDVSATFYLKYTL